MALKDDKRVVVYRTFDSVEANALAESLISGDVDAHVVGDFQTTAYAGVRLGGSGSVEVWIPASEREKAAPILAAWTAEHHDMAQREPKFQFSMQTVLVVLTLGALYMGAATAEPPWDQIAFVAMQALIMLGAVVFLTRRWFRERAAYAATDDDAAHSSPQGAEESKLRP